MPQDYFGNIKRDYLEFFNDTSSIQDRKAEARNVIQHIVKSFFADVENRERYDIYYSKKYAEKDPNGKYKTSYGNRFYFLINKKLIKRNLKSAFEFIWTEASEFGKAHKNMYGEGLDNTIQFHLFLNQILEWFLTENNKTTEYLIPFERTQSNVINTESITKLETELAVKIEESQRLKTKNKELITEKEELKKKLTLQTNSEQELTQRTENNKDLLLKSQTENNALIESKNKTLKRNKNLTIASWSLSLLLIVGIIYIFIAQNNLSEKETQIESLADSKKQSEEVIKKKNATIDSLKRVVLVTESKEEKNFGFKNEFKGNVGKVENHQNVNNLDDLDKE